ncbi:orotidine-5'-phosphate decarboxylase [uncultured Helicobacter sp.]|uniref:orotidine-5'-phosphate decarboxylase n=1 Tax=uncultured Helicobacter sp. TaxID=175537 RepID=UPI001C39918D|nr:orotidine-5'-phosphate decarboxylase [Candidatus Helicobacter avicola]
MNSRNTPKLCVALDRENRESNLALVQSLKSYSTHLWLKIGLRSFVRDGKEFLEELRGIGDFKLFLDLKLYDIPNTMLDAMREIHALGVDMITIHASSGVNAMRALAHYRQENPTAPRILAVTALTSFGEEDFGQIYNAPILNHARKMAVLAYENGCDGVVCSCFETQSIKAATHRDFIALTPGIRPFGEENSDQKRVADLAFAKRVGSDFIVVGRPIYKAQDPKGVVAKILESL